ncbi:hypothetical protein JHK87_021327 [Glycine soja]|nr:hypothetical protein JHK87_021327 [Glycine soja]
MDHGTSIGSSEGEAHGVREVAEAIASLEEIIGSSQYAKTKFIKGKHKELPPTYTKLVLIRLNKTVAASKLIKVKNSFKLAPIKPAPVKALYCCSQGAQSCHFIGH